MRRRLQSRSLPAGGPMPRFSSSFRHEVQIDAAARLVTVGLADRLPRAVAGASAMTQRGRPPGSLNKMTLQWAAYTKALHGPPLEQIARFAGLRIRAIAAELGCSREEAAEFKLQCIEHLLPYTHSEMPKA